MTREQFVEKHIREAKKLSTNTLHNITPEISRGKIGRVTITNAYGRLTLGVIERWKNTTNLDTKAYGIREIKGWLAGYYNQLKEKEGKP